MTDSTAAANKAALRRIVEAYGISDVGPLLNALHPDVIWISHAPSEFLRFGGKHVGRDNCVAGLSLMAAEYAMHHYEILEIIAEGDVVWMSSQLQISRRRGGPVVRLDVATRWQFDAGKIVHLTEYYDSATLLLRDGSIRAAG